VSRIVSVVKKSAAWISYTIWLLMLLLFSFLIYDNFHNLEVWINTNPILFFSLLFALTLTWAVWVVKKTVSMMLFLKKTMKDLSEIKTRINELRDFIRNQKD